MHVAFVIPYLGGNGAERVVYRLARGLAGRGHKVDIVLFHTIIHRSLPEEVRVFLPGDAPDRLTEERNGDVLARAVRLQALRKGADWVRVAGAFRWEPLCLPSRRLIRQTRAVAWYMETERPDCMLPHLTRSLAATLLAGRLLGGHPPVIPTVHSDVRYRSRRDRRRSRHLSGGAAHFVGVSRGVSDTLAAAAGVPERNITTIHNPVVMPDIRTRAEEPADHPWLSDGGPPVVLAAGRLSREKDYPTLIRAFALLAARRSCRLVILGQGEQRAALERLATSLGVADRLSLPGWVENPFAFMSRASVFVLSSIYEGLGNVLIEALACGCPCVSTDCPAGPAEILEDGRLGALVPVGDAGALADAIERVLDRPPDPRALRKRAEDFSGEASVAAYEALISTHVRPSASQDGG